MTQILYLDEGEQSKKVEEDLKGIESIIKFKITDPSSVDFILPILFTEFGSFTGERIKDYLAIFESQKKLEV